MHAASGKQVPVTLRGFHAQGNADAEDDGGARADDGKQRDDRRRDDGGGDARDDGDAGLVHRVHEAEPLLREVLRGDVTGNAGGRRSGKTDEFEHGFTTVPRHQRIRECPLEVTVFGPCLQAWNRPPCENAHLPLTALLPDA